MLAIDTVWRVILAGVKFSDIKAKKYTKNFARCSVEHKVLKPRVNMFKEFKKKQN